MVDLSEFEEMYLKRIFEIYDSEPSTIVKTSQLAKVMRVSNASTTEMIQRLSDRELLTYIPYKGCRLTPEGFKIAARIKRREGLLQILLSEVVGFEGDVDEAACKMEHDMSSELEEAIDRMLGYPERAPDGTKVPVIERNLDLSPKKYLLPLSYLPVGSTSKIEIIALDNTDQKTLEGMGLEVGTIITKEKEGVRFQEKVLKLSESLMKKILTRMEG
ncbi:MAG: hypothetical protein CMA78_00165 [Euryarchaeota archaeon]|nr:hypothetical protein [Euryarchaeota archaeon]|tara:strand:- start:53809 stop:54459 length:651 start_codon:yes stop_codon:yes gene_type:complete